jgi:hypothetical protein
LEVIWFAGGFVNTVLNQLLASWRVKIYPNQFKFNPSWLISTVYYIESLVQDVYEIAANVR